MDSKKVNLCFCPRCGNLDVVFVNNKIKCPNCDYIFSQEYVDFVTKFDSSENQVHEQDIMEIVSSALFSDKIAKLIELMIKLREQHPVVLKFDNYTSCCRNHFLFVIKYLRYLAKLNDSTYINKVSEDIESEEEEKEFRKISDLMEERKHSGLYKENEVLNMMAEDFTNVFFGMDIFKEGGYQKWNEIVDEEIEQERKRYFQIIAETTQKLQTEGSIANKLAQLSDILAIAFTKVITHLETDIAFNFAIKMLIIIKKNIPNDE
ncbi:hypothetical protein ACFL0W_04955 [Nanoarchaeota archaeon]